jgi:hypothetical protein
MKGLLQRLAARATGTAAMLRPDLQVPVAAAPASGGAVSVHNEGSAVVSGDLGSARPAPPPALANPALEPMLPDARLGIDAAALPPQPPQPDPRPLDQPPAAASGPQAMADTPVRGPPLSGSELLPPVGPALVITSPASPPLLAPPQVESARQAAPARFDGPAPPAAAAVEPAPWPTVPLLMPGEQPTAQPTAQPAVQPALQPPTRWAPQPTTQPVAQVHPAAARAAAAASAGRFGNGEATEVHVHIGRIDVTAVREAPAAARRRPAPAPAAPSLDSYLAQRRRG